MVSSTIVKSSLSSASLIFICPIGSSIWYVSRSRNRIDESQLEVCHVKKVKNTIINIIDVLTNFIFPPRITRTPKIISAIHITTLNNNACSMKNSNENSGAENHSLIRKANAPSSKYSSNL